MRCNPYIGQISYAQNLFTFSWVYPDDSLALIGCAKSLHKCEQRREEFIVRYTNATGHTISREWDGYQEVYVHHYPETDEE